MAISVVFGSVAKAVRFTSGLAYTNMPGDASSVSPSSSKRARPEWTK